MIKEWTPDEIANNTDGNSDNSDDKSKRQDDQKGSRLFRQGRRIEIGANGEVFRVDLNDGIQIGRDVIPFTDNALYIGDATHTLKGAYLGTAPAVNTSAVNKLYCDTNLGLAEAYCDNAFLKSFTCGENISAGNAVCLKNGYDTLIYPSADTYVNENSPTTNHDTATNMILGGVNNKENDIFMKFSMAGITGAESIIKAELHFRVTAMTGFTWSSVIQYCTSDWSEDGTVTFNNQPTTEAITTKVGNGYNTGNFDALTDYFIDITELVRVWKTGSLVNYGLKLCGDTGIKNRTISSKENATVASRPYLRIISSQVSDGYIYKTDSDDYALTRGFVGIATEAKLITESCKVQTLGINNDVICSSGIRYYLSPTAGAITNSVASQARLARVGLGVASNIMVIENDSSNLFIEKSKTYITAIGETQHLVFPPDAAYALIQYDVSAGGTGEISGVMRIDSAGLISDYVGVVAIANHGCNLSTSYVGSGIVLNISAIGVNRIVQYTACFYK